MSLIDMVVFGHLYAFGFVFATILRLFFTYAVVVNIIYTYFVDLEYFLDVVCLDCGKYKVNSATH